MSKHTPGPWSFVPTEHPRGTIITAHDGIYDIAVVRDANGKPENAANARLIAEAPELLEALKALADDAHRDSYQARRAAAWRLIRRIEGTP